MCFNLYSWRDLEARRQEAAIREAIKLMEKALNLLDRNNVPRDAGAHLDLAIHRLRAWIQERPFR